MNAQDLSKSTDAREASGSRRAEPRFPGAEGSTSRPPSSAAQPGPAPGAQRCGAPPPRQGLRPQPGTPEAAGDHGQGPKSSDDPMRPGAGAALCRQAPSSPLGREAGAGRPGVDARTHQIWNLSSGPVAYCIFNLLLGTPPRLAEASLRTTADAATRRSSRSLIFVETGAQAGRLQTETAASTKPSHEPLPTAQARSAKVGEGSRAAPAQPAPAPVVGRRAVTCLAALIHHHLGCVQTLRVQGREGEILLVRYKGGR